MRIRPVSVIDLKQGNFKSPTVETAALSSPEQKQLINMSVKCLQYQYLFWIKLFCQIKQFLYFIISIDLC